MIEAKSKKALLQSLSEMEIAVPERSGGRLSDHTEVYAIAYMLATLAREDKITYPFTLKKCERPDFLLLSGGEKIGVEHTEAVSENVAQSDFLREKGYGHEVQFLRYSAHGEKRKKGKRLISELEENDPGDGWMGDSVEREWAAAMFHSVKEKICTAQKPGYKLFESNWLLVYDNLTLPVLHLEEAIPIFRQLFSEGEPFSTFSSIFILTERQLCQFSKESLAVLPSNELWKKS
tara:strand:- start:867 stop:1568 length:702 start_codon:yes stop_codon:yes gene_type:complete